MIGFDEAARATGGTWLRPPPPAAPPLRGGAFDTRTVGDAEVFFALSGEGGDGHDHLHRLAGSGVRLAVVSRDAVPEGCPGAVLRVPDTLRALGAMARALVDKYRPAVVALTGSYGKTTTKEIVARVLEGPRRVLRNAGSFNNEIGVPVTLLDLDGSQDTVVLEFSARKPGDIDYLGRIAPPDVAVLLSVGHAHIGVFGTLEAIYRAKGEVFNHLRGDGLAVVAAGDPRLRDLAGARRVVTFGREAAADFRAEAITADGEGRQRFTGVHGATRLALHAGMPGPHGHEPVLVAWAVARALGVPDEAVTARAGVQPAQKGRAVLMHAPGGATLVDDSYNASPETVINLIGILEARPEADKVLVLGPLAELEAGLEDTARMIAAHLRPPLARCVVYDPASPLLAERLRAHLEAGPERGDGGPPVAHVGSQPALIEALQALDAPGRVIGIKGARSAHMERFVQALLGTRVACARHPCGLLKYCTDCDLLTGP